MGAYRPVLWFRVLSEFQATVDLHLLRAMMRPLLELAGSSGFVDLSHLAN